MIQELRDSMYIILKTGMSRPAAYVFMLLLSMLMTISVSSAAESQKSNQTSNRDWPTYGHDKGGMRYSPLTQINTTNVTQLQVAWTYHMRPANAVPPVETIPAEVAQRIAEGAAPIRRRSAASRYSASQTTPLVVNGVMYISTPYRRIVALQPESGQELWSYEVAGPGLPSLRGVEYWPGDGKLGARIVFGTRDGRLIALEADSGKPAAGFGDNGVVDLKTPEIMGTAPAGFGGYGMTSPPIVYRNLVITGSATQESPAKGPAGDVRAWDMRTGKLVWTFHTIPRAGEFGFDTWQDNSGAGRSGTNVWGLMTVDEQRGIVYMPVAGATWDRYGGDRLGANLFGSSIVALNARTGKRLWHFQVVHHDIWDMDTQAPPTLMDVKIGRRTLPAVAIVSKSGLFFLLNRVTGKPIHPIEERPVPASDVPGEMASPTQPFPVKTPPFARQSFALNDVATVTPELEAHCRNFIQSSNLRMGGPYLPLGFNTPTLNFPGRQGGANWGGGSYDPVSGYFFINANNLGQVEQLSRREDGSMSMAGPANGRFSDRDKMLMCQQPPWGTLTAINVSTGEIAWQSTLGVSDNVPAEVAKTGRPGVGGPITTAGGLVFIGATDDARLRAFDAKTGAELWAVKLDAAAHATPITYQGRDGRQYVAVVATGGSFLDSPISSDALTVFALPTTP